VGGGIYNNFRGGGYVGILTVSNSTFSGNTAAFGGGILNSGTLAVSNSTVSANSATYGGGIGNETALSLNSSTVSGNSASIDGGGIYADDGSLTISNSTVSGNSASNDGGGILNALGNLSITSSTVSGNSASSGGGIANHGSSATLASSIAAGNAGGDCSGTVMTNGYNLVGADCGFSFVGDQTVADSISAIGIKPLAYNGSKTQTMALIEKSPAVDAIPVSALAADGITPLCLAFGTTDQRGVKRPRGPACDVGAYERKL
jgi:predicted outer membrane repeat protein